MLFIFFTKCVKFASIYIFLFRSIKMVSCINKYCDLSILVPEYKNLHLSLYKVHQIRMQNCRNPPINIVISTLVLEYENLHTIYSLYKVHQICFNLYIFDLGPSVLKTYISLHISLRVKNSLNFGK